MKEQTDNQESAYVSDDGQVFTDETLREASKERLQGLYMAFTRMRDRWVQHRAQSGVEARWRTATELYYNASATPDRTTLESTLKNGPSVPQKGEQVRSKVVVNIVRPKVDQAVARMCEILFPVDDRNWAIKPTPIPEVADRVGVMTPTVDPATGQPTGLTADDEAQGLIKAAKEAGEGMQSEIDDALTECGYNSESRKIIEDMVRLGTGIIKGPFPTRKTKKAWKSVAGASSMQISDKIRPSSKRCDPWDVFFDPAAGNDHQRGRGGFERRSVTRKEIRALIGTPGYDENAIREVLLESPRRVRVAEGRVQREDVLDDSYELWEYHGEIEPQDMEFLSLNAGDQDPVNNVDFAVVVMINDKIVGAIESWVDDKSIPYDVCNWRKSDSTPQGYGLCDELAQQQGVVNGAWRQVMDNARNSMGGQIVMRKGAVVPQNGRMEVTPNKMWIATDATINIKDVFATYEFASHLEELLAVAQAAMSFSDMETGMPQMMGGENGANSPDTVGGMIMLYNNANAVLRQRVKLFDDCITRPHIGRHYDYQMANNPDPTIKGDFEVDARGSSALIERDIQNQAWVNLAGILNASPRYTAHLMEREELKAILKAFRINPDDVMKTEDQVQKDLQNTPPQQDPRIVSAQMMLEAKKLDIDDRIKQRDFDAARNQKDDEYRHQQLQYNAQREQGEFTIAQTDSAIKRDSALLNNDTKLGLGREQIASKERLQALTIENQRQIFNAEASLRVNTGEGI